MSTPGWVPSRAEREGHTRWLSQLPRREALARGRSNNEIASALGVGERTVKTHVSNILSNLHLADRTQAAI